MLQLEKEIIAINFRRYTKRFTKYLHKNSGDHTNKIESAKERFSNIIKRIPPESYKKFKINYDQSNNIDIREIKYESDDNKFTN